MKLDDLKRAVEEGEKRKEDDELRKREQGRRRRSEIIERGNVDLPHLQALEESFWNFTEKFSGIINKKVAGYSKRKKVLGIFSRSSIRTREIYGTNELCYPELSASFDEPDRSNNIITLVAKEGTFYFKGSHFRVSSVGTCFSSNNYADHESEISLNNFEKTAAIEWLEQQFVKYCDEYIKNYHN